MSLQLTIGNSVSRIAGLTVAQHSDLKRILSYKTQVQFGSGRQNRDVTLLSKRGEFPTGLVYLAAEWIDASLQVCDVVDTRVKPMPCVHFDQVTALMAHVPYQEQADAAETCQRHHRGIISMPTGVGKTLVTALIIDRLRVRTLVVVPKLELKRQTIEALTAVFGTEGMRYITVENVDALDPNTPANYDCVIIDEFHHAAAATYRKLNKKAWAGVYYRFGLTATPFRSDEDERLLLESVLSQVIYRLTYQEAVAKGYIVPVEAYYLTVPPKAADGYSWHQVYAELVTANAARNVLIRDLLMDLKAAGKSTLCLVREVDHGHELLNLIGASCLFAHGQNEDTRHYIALFNRGQLLSLLGTTGVLSEGVDTKPCEYVVVAGLGKSKNQFMQQVGRAVRKYPGKESAKVIIFKDQSHKWTRAHFAAQKKILQEEYGVTPVEIKLT